MKLTKDIFELFAGDEHVRRPLNDIAKKENYAIATNGHILIRANLNDIDFTPETVEGFPDSAAIMVDKYKKLITDTQPFQVNVAELQQTLSDVPKEEIHKTTECSSCDGEGIEYCDCCGHEYECDHCCGEGVLITNQVTARKYSTVHNVRIDVQYYKAKPLQIIVDAAQKLNQRTLVWYSLPQNTSTKPGTLVVLPKAEILIMPVRMTGHKSAEDEQSFNIHILPISKSSATD